MKTRGLTYLSILFLIVFTAVIAAKAHRVGTSQNGQNTFYNKLSMNRISFEIIQKGNKLLITPGGYTLDNRTRIHEIDGNVVSAEIDDLEKDGFPELFIYIHSDSDHHHGSVIVYSSIRNKSMVEVIIDEQSVSPDLQEGYNGYDEFTVIGSYFYRKYPLFTHDSPTGKSRTIRYSLIGTDNGKKLIADKTEDQ